MAGERLDKILSHHGFGTRKDTRRMIRRGLVVVNGKVCTEPDSHVDLETAQLSVDGENISATAPLYREDVFGYEDLAEEVIRLYGYSHIQPQMLEH